MTKAAQPTEGGMSSKCTLDIGWEDGRHDADEVDRGGKPHVLLSNFEGGYKRSEEPGSPSTALRLGSSTCSMSCGGGMSRHLKGTKEHSYSDTKWLH